MFIQGMLSFAFIIMLLDACYSERIILNKWKQYSSVIVPLIMSAQYYSSYMENI